MLSSQVAQATRSGKWIRPVRSVIAAVAAVAAVAVAVAVAVGSTASVAHAVYLPAFPPSPSRFEVPAGKMASGVVPLPWMCKDSGGVHGVMHAQVGKPQFDGTMHAVSHVAFVNLCTADAGMLVQVAFESEFTGVVTTFITVQGKDEAGGTAGPIGPHIIEFYMGVEMPDAGGEAGMIALVAALVLVAGGLLTFGARRTAAG